MDFSVIIATRNRPELFERALKSVLRQTHNSFEVIVVNDGSDSDYQNEYKNIERRISGNVRFIYRDKNEKIHGPSVAFNTGWQQAFGKYICSLDDDDFWIHDDHLKDVYRVIVDNFETVEVYFSCQQANLNGEVVRKGIWLSGFQEYAWRRLKKKKFNVYEATAKDLFSCQGFCHLNTTIIKKDLLEKMNGFDESLLYEGDFDFYIRIVDKAKKVIFSPVITSQHNVPDPTRKINVSTCLSDLHKLEYRLAIMNKAISGCDKKETLNFAQKHKAYTLKKIARLFQREHNYDSSLYYAKEALRVGFTWKWLLFYFFIRISSLFNRVKLI